MVIAASGLDKISKESVQAEQQRDLKIQSCFGASTFETWLEGKKKNRQKLIGLKQGNMILKKTREEKYPLGENGYYRQMLSGDETN